MPAIFGLTRDSSRLGARHDADQVAGFPQRRPERQIERMIQRLFTKATR